jgi:spermidine/putrescine transport system ATP-binding protein
MHFGAKRGTAMKTMVELVGVDKHYGTNHVVRQLNLTVNEGEFLTLLGPSGCGKTTTLRMIAGFETPNAGCIRVAGVNVEEKEPYERDVNTVFQSYALFPYKTIEENIGFGLKMKKVPKKEIRDRVKEMLSMVQLDGYGSRMPSQLSGGQKQRVAIARALINQPKVLLLDEPLGALDLKLRKQMQIELKRLQKKLGITFVYVTHDQEEALTMSDRIAVMNGGVIEQLDVPDAIYERPASRFVAEFIGESNVLDGTITESDDVFARMNTETGRVSIAGGDYDANEFVHLSIRPEKLQFSMTEVAGFNLAGIVREHVYVGSVIKCMVMLPNGQELKLARLVGSEIPAVDSAAHLWWKAEDAVVMRTKSHQILNMIDSMELR